MYSFFKGLVISRNNHPTLVVYIHYKYEIVKLIIVRMRGLEPPRVSPHGPKPCAYANSATSADRSLLRGFTYTTRLVRGLEGFF